ncbi:Capsular polysaccharide synthesis enzyme Cap8C; Manganese-dependent protein-tyrosine phosphatase [hydrothermal vent metagenome]|uniref:Capsular polysaccharide synthesis enzyme Cap8C Manganese-dependent protein-tyrosine phosphatase n=1 Tax=hydrothermal vent metagenome TaxID=652676 RepID=A0A1W1BK07_9ZZZZ
MFSFLSNKKSLLRVDIHSHLIPGIDDGAKTMENSIELILDLKEIGYKKLITTPHISDMFPNSKEIILNEFENLKSEVKKREIEIELEVAAEYYADETFDRLLKEKNILNFGKENYLLFELSYFTKPQDLESLIYEIQLAGYTPVLAHPERYTYFHNSIDNYKQLKKATDVLFQMNIVSIVNYYSNEITKVAKQLINAGLIDFIGSDTHQKRHTKYIKKSLSDSFYKKIFKKNVILNDSLG